MQKLLSMTICPALVAVSDMGPARPRMKWGGKTYDTWDGNERYLHYDDMPQHTDRNHAMLAGGDVKCEACSGIIRDLLNGLSAKKLLGQGNDEVVIFDALEAALSDEEKELATKDGLTDMEKYVAYRRAGCNKLFKDNWLAQGWRIRSGHQLAEHQPFDAPTEQQAPWAFARQSSRLPSAKDMDTYSVQNEAMFYACEATIGRHSDDIAEALVKELKTTTPDKLNLDEICQKVGKCLQRPAHETAEARVAQVMKRLHFHDGDVDDTLAKMKKKILKSRAADKKNKPDEEPDEKVDTVEL